MLPTAAARLRALASRALAALLLAMLPLLAHGLQSFAWRAAGHPTHTSTNFPW